MNTASTEPAFDPGKHAGQFRISRERGNAVAMVAFEVARGARVLRDGVSPDTVRSLDAAKQARRDQTVQNPVEGDAVHLRASCRHGQIVGEFVMGTRLTGTFKLLEYGNGERRRAQPGLPQAQWPVGGLMLGGRA